MDSVSKESKETTEDFVKRMTRVFSDSMVVLSLAVGIRTGLLQKVASYTEPKTSVEIAQDTRLKERYVREWLAVMTTGGVVDLVPGEDSTNRFLVPEHRRQTLLSSQVAAFSVIPILAQTHIRLAECFQQDGPLGLPQDSYPDLHGTRALWTQLECSEGRFRSVLEKVPGLIPALESGITACDVGCSSGVRVMHVAETFPNSHVLGLDFDQDGIDVARQSAAAKSINNCHFHVADICNLSPEWIEKFDYIFINDTLHDLPSVPQGLQGLKSALKPGGHLSILEKGLHSEIQDNLNEPSAPFLYGAGLFYCVPSTLSTGVVTEGAYGPAWGVEKAMEFVGRAGFAHHEVVSRTPTQVHILARK